MLSSESTIWRTPPEVLDPTRELAAPGRIGLDPCAGIASPVGADIEYSLELGFDGLILPWTWQGPFYVNSPFGRWLADWVKKCLGEADAGAEGIQLTPSRTGSGWCQELMLRSDAHCFLKKRLTFLGGVEPTVTVEVPAPGRRNGVEGGVTMPAQRRIFGEGGIGWGKVTSAHLVDLATPGAPPRIDPAPFDCMVSYFGPRVMSFRRVFEKRGVVHVHPRRRMKGKWHYLLHLEMGDGKWRWKKSEELSYTRARGEFDAWRSKGYAVRLKEAGDDQTDEGASNGH